MSVQVVNEEGPATPVSFSHMSLDVIPGPCVSACLAGCVAAQMGLPLRLVAAVNTNDIVFRTLSSGDFSKSDEVVVSLAPAMDIQVGRTAYVIVEGSSLYPSIFLSLYPYP